MQVTQQKHRNLFLDLFRIVLVYLVVDIHFGINLPIDRIAVPMFFMIAGYFLCANTHEEEKLKAKRLIKNSSKYLAIGILFYMTFDFIMILATKGDLPRFFHNLFPNDIFKNIIILNGPITSGGHLWFLIALLIAGILHYLLIKFNKTKFYYIIIPVCLFVFFFFGSYIKLLDYNPLSVEFTRNGLFMGLPMTGIGYCLGKAKFLRKKHYLKWIYLLLGITMFGLQMLEVKLMPMECYITSIVSAIFLLLFFVNLPSPKADFYYKYIGKGMPFYIYMLHLTVGNFLMPRVSTPRTILPLLVFAISFAIYEITFLCNLLIKYIITKCTPTKLDSLQLKV